MEASELFSLLKPLCCAVIQLPSCDSVRQLQLQLDKLPVDRALLTPLQEYVVFPLEVVFKSKPRDEKLVLSTLKCLQLICERSVTVNQHMAMTLLSRIAALMSFETKSDDLPVPASEELRLVAVGCCRQLMSSCSDQLLVQLYSSGSCQLALGHLVYQLTAIVAADQNRTLRIEAMTCLQTLTCPGHVTVTSHLHQRSSLLFCGFLPGIASALFKVYSGDVKQGHHVIAKALDVWCDVVCHVISDDVLDGGVTSLKSLEVEEEPSARQFPVVERTEKWVVTTAARISTMLPGLQTLTQHQQSSVRHSLCRLADLLLHRCARSLSTCRSRLLQLLTVLTCDDLVEVSGSAQRVLERLMTDSGGGGDGLPARSLVETLEEDLFRLTGSLPDIVRAHDGDSSVSQLCLLEGYLRVLGPAVHRLTAISSHLDQLLSCLLQLVELCPESALVRHCVTSVEPLAVQQVEGDHWTGSSSSVEVVAEPWQLLHLDRPALWRRVATSCRLLGCHGDLLTVLEQLQQRTESTSCSDADGQHSDEAQLLWNLVILGQETSFVSANCGGSATFQLHSLLDQTDLESLCLSLSPSHRRRRRCLALQAIAHVARVTRGCAHHVSAARMYVLTLGPVLEAAGGGDPTVAYMARATLLDMAGHEGVACMLRRYLHRLAVHMRHRLQQRGQSRLQAAWMLCALLPHLSADSLILLEDAIDALLVALDLYYEECGVAFLTALSCLVNRMVAWYPLSFPPPPGESTSDQPSTEALTGVDRFLAHHREQLQLQEDLDRIRDGSDFDSDTDAPPSGETAARNDGVQDAGDVSSSREDTAPPPLHVRLVCDVLGRCARLLDADLVPVRVLALDTLAAGTQLLSRWPDQLLPLLHTSWPQLLRCCCAGRGDHDDSRSLPVLRHALRCLLAVARAGGDFLRRRITDKDGGRRGPLMPLLDWLTAAASVKSDASAARRPPGNYRLTQRFKLQREALTTLPHMCVCLQVDMLVIQAVTRAVSGYLCCRQPPELQDLTVELLTILGGYDGDNVWWCLTDINQQLPDSTRQQYAVNIDSVLSRLDTVSST